MELFIALCSSIAFLALIVYLWNSGRDSEEGRGRSDDTSQPATLSKKPEASLILIGSESPQMNAFQPPIDVFTREGAELLRDENDAQTQANNQLELQQAGASDPEYSQRIAAVEAENSILRSRVTELDCEWSSGQAEISSLRSELERLAGIEHDVAILNNEKSELFDQIRKLQGENEANVRKLLALQELEAKQPELEEKLAQLSEQNERLLEEIAQLQSFMRDKIKMQLDGLQELYQNLSPRMNELF